MDEVIVDLWLGELTGNEGAYPYFQSYLDQSERQRAGQFSSISARISYAEGHARVRLVLGKLLACDPKTLCIDKAEFGKPYLAEYPGCVFNVSHTANKMIVAAGAHCLLGVDIECIKPRKNISGLAEKCFAGPELAYWRQLPEHEQTEAFYRFWVRKEAFVKAVGKGIALGLNTVAIDPVNPDKLLTLPAEYGRTEAWQFRELAISPGICGALAVKLDANCGELPLNLRWHTLP